MGRGQELPCPSAMFLPESRDCWGREGFSTPSTNHFLGPFSREARWGEGCFLRSDELENNKIKVFVKTALVALTVGAASTTASR